MHNNNVPLKKQNTTVFLENLPKIQCREYFDNLFSESKLIYMPIIEDCTIILHEGYNEKIDDIIHLDTI